MKLPTISVIIPLYNAEKYIGECLCFKRIYMTTPPHELDKILREEFAGNSVALTAFIFNAFNGLCINA